MSSDITGIIDLYCAVWNEADPVRRKVLLEAVWAEGAGYTDPRADTHGGDELLAHIDNIRASRPGATIARTTAVDVHHGMARFGWRVVLADGTALPEGIDIALLTPDGTRITRIIGFFGPMLPI